MRPDNDDVLDIELRLVDPATNRFRMYGLTECRTLFGELCLRIVWGRIGNRRPRERTEVFEHRTALERRRDELLARRRRHGYVRTPTVPDAAERRTQSRRTWAIERAILEAHGLPLDEKTARTLVARWHAATVALLHHVEAKGAGMLDLVDVSTLAGMFVSATGAAA